AIVSEVPFVACLTTILDDSLPLTVIEWEEWGNPVQDPEVYAYMKSYSPYDNVEAKDYPAMLVRAGLSDPRVGYWEPAKWVAKLRAVRTDDNTLVLKTDLGADGSDLQVVGSGRDVHGERCCRSSPRRRAVDSDPGRARDAPKEQPHGVICAHVDTNGFRGPETGPGHVHGESRHVAQREGE